VTGPEAGIRVREMGYAVDEFAAVLPAAMRDWSVGGGPYDWQVMPYPGGPVARIQVDPRPARRVGALCLPVLMVTIDCSALSAVLAAEFARRFDRGFHRGGG